mmetsp:Transcript_18998/g.46653  ORF Transcript_18998/g.46653 Transcript_18998/m.46653 type:complete len:496 (+) Transcript_18998:66-1553(+)
MKYGLNQWDRISSLLINKTAKQCKSRWFLWLNPTLIKTSWNFSEDERLIYLSYVFPSQWSTIGPLLGRTPESCLRRFESLINVKLAKGNYINKEKLCDNLDTAIILNPESRAPLIDDIRKNFDMQNILVEARARLANSRGKKARRITKNYGNYFNTFIHNAKILSSHENPWFDSLKNLTVNVKNLKKSSISLFLRSIKKLYVNESKSKKFLSGIVLKKRSKRESIVIGLDINNICNSLMVIKNRLKKPTNVNLKLKKHCVSTLVASSKNIVKFSNLNVDIVTLLEKKSISRFSKVIQSSFNSGDNRKLSSIVNLFFSSRIARNIQTPRFLVKYSSIKGKSDENCKQSMFKNMSCINKINSIYECNKNYNLSLLYFIAKHRVPIILKKFSNKIKNLSSQRKISESIKLLSKFSSRIVSKIWIKNDILKKIKYNEELMLFKNRLIILEVTRQIVQQYENISNNRIFVHCVMNKFWARFKDLSLTRRYIINNKKKPMN